MCSRRGASSAVPHRLASTSIALGFALAFTLSACGAAGPGPVAAQESAIPIDRLFPLRDGYVYSYITTADEGGSSPLIARASRTGPASGELRWGSSSKRFEFRADGVINAATGSYLLKSPLAVGASWRGDHGLVRVASIDASPSIPAGRFKACVETIEERGGDLPARFTTVFCPDVGIVVFEALTGVGGASSERTELRSYAPSVDLGPDGLTITKP